jgi:hypothetical protein
MTTNRNRPMQIGVLCKTLYLMLLSFNSGAHGNEPCRNCIFNFKQQCKVDYSQLRFIKKSYVKLTANGNAFYCASENQITTSSAKGDFLCSTSKSFNLLPERKSSAPLTDSHFTSKKTKLAKFNFLKGCDAFIVHKEG